MMIIVDSKVMIQFLQILITLFQMSFLYYDGTQWLTDKMLVTTMQRMLEIFIYDIDAVIVDDNEDAKVKDDDVFNFFSSETIHDAGHFQELIEGTITLTSKLFFSDP